MYAYDICKEWEFIFKGGACVSTFPAPLKGTIPHKRPLAPAGLLRRALRTKPPYRSLKIPEASRRLTAGQDHTMQPRKLTHRITPKEKVRALLLYLKKYNKIKLVILKEYLIVYFASDGKMYLRSCVIFSGISPHFFFFFNGLSELIESHTVNSVL